MEFCINKATGRILSARPNGAVWGSGESYARWVADGNEANRWMDRKLLVIKCPGISDADGFRYQDGLVSIEWLTDNELPEPELTEQEFTSIAVIGAETEPV